MFDKAKEDIRELLTGSDVENDMRARLHADHNEISRLMSSLPRAGSVHTSQKEMREKIDDALDALIAHLRAEEDVVYSALSRRPATASLALHSLKEHDELELLIREVRLFGRGDLAIYRSIERLSDAIAAHIHREESSVLPQAEREFGREYLASLIPLFNEGKAKIIQDLATDTLPGAGPLVWEESPSQS